MKQQLLQLKMAMTLSKWRRVAALGKLHMFSKKILNVFTQ